MRAGICIRSLECLFGDFRIVLNQIVKGVIICQPALNGVHGNTGAFDYGETPKNIWITGNIPPFSVRVSQCGKACNGVPQREGIGDQVDPPSLVVETLFHRATPFHQATTERPAGLICGEKIGLARRRLPPTAVPSRSGSEMSAECGTPLYAD